MPAQPFSECQHSRQRARRAAVEAMNVVADAPMSQLWLW